MNFNEASVSILRNLIGIKLLALKVCYMLKRTGIGN